MSKVLCYGVVGVDVLLKIRSYPEANGHARVQRETTMAGGEAANTAVRLSQLGVEVVLMGNPVGDDAHGKVFRDHVAGTDVDCRVETGDGTTGHAFVITDDDGNRTIFGAFGDLVGQDVPDTVFDEADLVTVDPFVDGAVQVARTARRRGLPVVSIEVEPGDALAPFSDVVINSAGLIRRHELGDPEVLARKLLESGPRIVIVTRGAEGADVYTREASFRQPVHPVDAVDTTGAGDGFRAGYILGYLLGQDLRTRVRTASVSAALSCCYFGGCGGVVDRETVLGADRLS